MKRRPYAPDVVAQAILEAAQYPHRDIYVGANAKLRICFVWRDGGAENVEIVDYH